MTFLLIALVVLWIIKDIIDNQTKPPAPPAAAPAVALMPTTGDPAMDFARECVIATNGAIVPVI